MKILHLCLASFYIDNYAYQENLLPKYHKKLGHDVEIIASLVSFDENGRVTLLKEMNSYNNEYGIPVTRLKYKHSKFSEKLRRYVGTYKAIKKSNPDLIFVHGCQFSDMKHVIKYLKENSSVKVYVDNHADFSNSATNWISKNFVHKVIWKYWAQKIEPFTTKFYGVLPARADFLEKVYKLPPEKIELLVMGADDEKVYKARNENVRARIRKKYSIENNDFLIVTGGKIDHNKTQTLLLMEYVKNHKNKNLKLLIFGTITPELKAEFELLMCENIHYIGWIESSNAYNYFYASDLVVFPGLHSVMWEQAVGLGKPCVFKYIEGFTHIDLGGNCRFLYEDTVLEIEKVIDGILTDESILKTMNKVAKEKGMLKFSYKKIAEKVFES